MMGSQAEQDALFYNFSLDRHVPATCTGTLVNDGATLLYRASKIRLRSMPDEAAVLPEDTGAQGASIDLRGRARHGP